VARAAPCGPVRGLGRVHADGWCLERRDATLAWAAAELRVGNPGAVIGPVTELIEQYPLVESLPAMLMRALHAAGRRIDALDCYTTTAQRLDVELCTSPGAELKAVHQAILRGETDLPRRSRDVLIAQNSAEGVPGTRRTQTPAKSGWAGTRAVLRQAPARALPGEHRAIVCAAAAAGLRWAECAGLP
jgi:Bacterial transcriptional activator domain